MYKYAPPGRVAVKKNIFCKSFFHPQKPLKRKPLDEQFLLPIHAGSWYIDSNHQADKSGFVEATIMDAFGINEMLEMQKTLQDKYKDRLEELYQTTKGEYQ